MYMYMQLCCTRVHVRNCAGRDIVSQATVYVQIKMYMYIHVALACVHKVATGRYCTCIHTCTCTIIPLLIFGILDFSSL